MEKIGEGLFGFRRNGLAREQESRQYLGFEKFVERILKIPLYEMTYFVNNVGHI